LYKKFANSQVKTLITRYLKKEIGRKYIQEILGLKKTRFFALIKQLKEDPENFSISYSRKVPTRKISKDRKRFHQSKRSTYIRKFFFYITY